MNPDGFELLNCCGLRRHTSSCLGRLRELLPNIDVLICNQREAAAIAGVPLSGRRPTWAEMDEAVRRLQADGAPLVVVTLGADGALAASAEQWWFQPTQPRAVVDTTGAGDAFAAGFLFGWCGSRDVERGLVYGCACGAAAVGQIGGSSPLDADSINAGATSLSRSRPDPSPHLPSPSHHPRNPRPLPLPLPLLRPRPHQPTSNIPSSQHLRLPSPSPPTYSHP